MPKIVTSKGTELEIKGLAVARVRGESRMMIETFASVVEAAKALDGCDWIRHEHDSADGVVTQYEGYNRISMISATDYGARVTLMRS